MTEIKTKRQYQDSLFRTIFGREEHKPWLLELYNALNKSSYSNVEDLTLTTIDDVVYIKMKNDISFLLDSRMHLYEHQSSYNPNMPLRGLFYFVQLYQDYLSSRNVGLFTSSLRKIPTPEYVVFYTGSRELADITELKLSDAFEVPRSDSKFEWTCKVINLNAEHNAELHKKCKPLYDYCRFVTQVKQNKGAGMSLAAATEAAVDWAIEENLLNGLFKKERSQIMGNILYEFDQDLYERDIFQDGKEEGIAIGLAEGEEKGRAEGERKKALEAAQNALAMGLTATQAAQLTGLSLEEVAQLK